MIYHVELTDTFGGERNYGWVRRKNITVEPTLDDDKLFALAVEAVDADPDKNNWDFVSTPDGVSAFHKTDCVALWAEWAESEEALFPVLPRINLRSVEAK